MNGKRTHSCGSPKPEDEPPAKSMKPNDTPAPAMQPPEEMPSTSSGSSTSTPANVQLYNNLQPVRLLRVGSRRSRNRPNRKIRYAMRYAQATGMDPTRLEETFRLEEANTLVAVAIEHYAKTVSSIVDELEVELLSRDKGSTKDQEELADVPMETDTRVTEVSDDTTIGMENRPGHEGQFAE